MRIVLILVAMIPLVLACPDEDYCVQCNIPEKKCIQCDGVVFDTKKNTCNGQSKPITNCVRYSSGDKIVCTRCANGFGVNGDGSQCAKCDVDGCALCPGDQKKCQACYGSKVLDVLFEKCTEDKDIKNENCEVNVSDSIGKRSGCIDCKKGYSLDNRVCVAEKIANCAEVSGEQCQVCRPGYFLTADHKCAVNGSVGNKTKPSRWWVWLLVVLVIVAAAGGAYWFFKLRPQQRYHNNEALIV